MGLAITIAWQDLLLLDYFAIAEDLRGQGCGAQALRLLQERYQGKRLLLEIETPDVPSENHQQRLRRRLFYQSCGMDSMDYHVGLFGVEMEIMTFQCRVGFHEYHAIFSGVYGKRFARRVTLAMKGQGRKCKCFSKFQKYRKRKLTILNFLNCQNSCVKGIDKYEK